MRWDAAPLARRGEAELPRLNLTLDPVEARLSQLDLYLILTLAVQVEARLSYLDYVKSWKIYGSTYYLAEPVAAKLLPPEVPLP